MGPARRARFIIEIMRYFSFPYNKNKIAIGKFKILESYNFFPKKVYWKDNLPVWVQRVMSFFEILHVYSKFTL